MFEIGFPELVILAVVALLVLGPERLPKAARFAGLWVRRARAHWYSVKSEFERELAAEELRKSLQDSREAMRGFQDSIRESEQRMHSGYEDLKQSGSAQGAAKATESDLATSAATGATTSAVASTTASAITTSDEPASAEPDTPNPDPNPARNPTRNPAPNPDPLPREAAGRDDVGR